MKTNTTKTLFESEDATLNVSLLFDIRRFLLGYAFSDSDFNRDIRMKLIVLHLGIFAFSFTTFRVKPRDKSLDVMGNGKPISSRNQRRLDRKNTKRKLRSPSK